MEQEVLLEDVLPYIQLWTLAVAAVLLVMSYRLWHFSKQHPEIFKADKTNDDKRASLEKADLRRRYNNESMLSLSVIFIWVIGMVLICFNFSSPTPQGWFLLVFAVCAVLWVCMALKKN
ncbi:MAG: hypothetical protein IJ689_00265 [Alphaproteobacteria bacterium]|nr:hypothetical protein [Alphaproteobacteria bacterium]